MSSPKTLTLAAAALIDPDAIITTVATVAEAAAYVGSDFDGAAAPDNDNATANIVAGAASYFVATLASNASSYEAGSTITVTGTFRGEVVTDELTIVGTDGGEVLTGDQPFDTVSSIDIEAQADTSGAFTFGFSGFGPVPKVNNREVHFAGIQGIETGNVHLGFHDGSSDTIPTVAGRTHPAAPKRIYGDSTAGVTLYWPDVA